MDALPCDVLQVILELLDYRSVCGVRGTCHAWKDAVRDYALSFERELVKFYTYAVVEKKRRGGVATLLKYAKKECPAPPRYRCGRCGAAVQDVGDCTACVPRLVLVLEPRSFRATKILLWLFLCALLVAQPQLAMRATGVALWVHAVLDKRN